MLCSATANNPRDTVEDVMIEFEFDDRLEACLVCGSPDIGDKLVDHAGITISGCRACGFQFMNPQYSDRYLDAFYSHYSDNETAQDWHEALLYGHGFHFSLIEKHMGAGKVLDVGCGHGHLLEAALARGWTAHGFDVDETSTRAASARLGIDVDYGDIFTSNLDGDYDLVAMHQVLEHIKDPDRYLAKVHSLIRPGSYLFIAVPNIKSMSSRFKNLMERLGIRKKNLGKYYDTSHHVLYFEPRTLAALLARHGFKVVEQRNCLAVRPGQPNWKRFVMKNLTNRLFAKSTFLFIAQKI